MKKISEFLVGIFEFLAEELHIHIYHHHHTDNLSIYSECRCGRRKLEAPFSKISLIDYDWIEKNNDYTIELKG